MRPTLLFALLLMLAAASPARAGQSYDNCSGFIDSVPATLTTQGVWCLRADLSTALASGFTIRVQVNNVTIDCNDFKLGGLAAGPDSIAIGIYSEALNTVVRNCNVRGFLAGIRLQNGGGYLVENNRLDGNLLYGIYVVGSGSLVQDNRVFDTGRSTQVPATAYGIYAGEGTDIIGNTVTNVSALDANATTNGIYTQFNGDGSIRSNRIKGVTGNGNGIARGIFNANSDRIVVRDNDVQGSGSAGSIGIRCLNSLGSAVNNVIAGYVTPIQSCTSSMNHVIPD